MPEAAITHEQITAETTTQPILWEMSRKFDLVFNIRNSSVTDTIGVIAIELEGPRTVIERVVRSSRRTPTRVSRRATARPTPEGVNPRASAARAIDPASTTAISTVTPESRRPS